MKKLLIAFMLLVSTSAMAGAFVGIEGEFENGINTKRDNYSLSIIPGYTFDSGIKADLKLQGSQNDINDTSISIEPRVSYGVHITDNWVVSLRGSVGEKLQKGGDYNFYTIEPIISYVITPDLYLKGSIKYKDSFGAKDIQTETVYFGGGYKLTKNTELSAKAYRRFDSVQSTGMEVNYTVGF